MISWFVETVIRSTVLPVIDRISTFLYTLPELVQIMALLSYICHRIHFGTVIA